MQKCAQTQVHFLFPQSHNKTGRLFDTAGERLGAGKNKQQKNRLSKSFATIACPIQEQDKMYTIDKKISSLS